MKLHYPFAIITDHGSLQGLNDNDHNQYALLDGANQPFTGNLEIAKVLSELKLTSAVDGNSTRLIRTDVEGVAQRFNTAEQLGGLTPGNAVDLDGGDDCIDISGLVSDVSSDTTGSIVMWVYADELLDQLFTISDADALTYLSFGFENGDSKLQAIVRKAGVNQWVLRADDLFSAGAWHHVGLVQDGVSPVLYVDKVAVAQTLIVSTDTTAWLSDLSGLDTAKIGCLAFSGAGNILFFNGKIDEVAYWSEALSANDIGDLYDGGAGLLITPSDSWPTDGGLQSGNLSGLWHHEESAMNTAPGGADTKDFSVNANHGIFEASMTDGDLVEGHVNIVLPGSDQELSVWRSEDGDNPLEKGIQTYGDPDGRTVIDGKTHEFHINGLEVGSIDENGTFLFDNGEATVPQLILKAANGVSEHIFEVQDTLSNILLAVDPDGDLNVRGNTILGDSIVSGDLTLMSTSHATKGKIIFNNEETGMVYDGDNERATIGGGGGAHTINGSVEKALFEFHTDGNTQPGGTVYHRHSNTASLSADAVWLKSSGDHDNPTIVADGEQLGHLRFAGYDGTDYAMAAEIGVFIDGTPGDDDMPGRIVFLTSPNESQAPIESFRIKQDQSILIAAANRLQFRDTAIGMYSQADGLGDLFADDGWRVGDSSGGAPTNYIKFASNGTVSQVGTARIGWTKIAADNITQGAGTHSGTTGDTTGFVADIDAAHDGNFYHIDEAGADPGFELTVEFVSVTAFNWVNILASYSGTSAHSVQIALYNFNTTTWDCFGAFPPSKSEVATAGEYTLENHDFFVPSDTDYVGTDGDAGDVRVRFRHTIMGNAAHDLDIDVVALYQ